MYAYIHVQALVELKERKRLQREEDAVWHTRLLDLVRKAEQREASDRNRFLDLRSDMLKTLEEQVHTAYIHTHGYALMTGIVSWICAQICSMRLQQRK
jgi:hypothetical protein